MKKLIRFILVTTILFSYVYGSLMYAENSKIANDELISEIDIIENNENIQLDTNEENDLVLEEIIELKENKEESIEEEVIDLKDETINLQEIVDIEESVEEELINNDLLEETILEDDKEKMIETANDIDDKEYIEINNSEDKENFEYSQIKEMDELFKQELQNTLSDDEILNIVNGYYSPFLSSKSRMMMFSNQIDTKIILTNFTVSQIYDGTPIWDNDDNPGNDSNSSNKIVRSFDKVVYRTAYSTISEDNISTVTNGTFYFKAILPISPDIASWDLNAMGWLENVNVITTSDSSILEGSITINNQNVSPRVGTINWVISVNDAKNDTIIPAPIFTMSIDDTSLETYGEDIRVSAKTYINARLQYEGDVNSNPVFGLLLELISNKPGKGMKGQEIPDINKTINLVLETSPNQTIYKFKNNYSIDGDDFISRNLPYDDKHDELITTFNKVFNGGDINIIQDNQNLNVEISNYSFDSLFNKVTHNSSKNNLDGQNYSDDYYPFGAYVITLNDPKLSNEIKVYSLEIKSLQAFSLQGDVINDFDLSDNKDTYTRGIPVGGGFAHAGGPVNIMDVSVINPTTKEVFSLIKKDADRNLPPDFKVYPGDLIKVRHGTMLYKSPNREYIETYWGLMKFDTNMFEALNTSEEFSSPTSFDEPLLKEFYWVAKSDKTGWINEEEMYNAHINQIKNQNGYKLFNNPDDAIDSGYTIVAFLSKAVFENPSYVITFNGPVFYPAIKVKPSALINKDTNEMYLNNDPNRVKVILGELEAIDFKGNIYKRENIYNSLGDELDMYLHHQDIKLGLIKATYDINGDLITPTRSNAIGNGGGNYTHAAALVGGAFYIQPYTTYVNKHVSQKINEFDEKEVFNLDTDQTQVFYNIELGTSAPIKLNSVDNITFMEIIPKYLNPINDSKDIEEKWGIVYDAKITQDKNTNGSAGIILTDYSTKANESQTWNEITSKIKSEPSYSISEDINEKGETILTWKFNNYPVSYKLPTIHYSALINKDVDYGEKIVTLSKIKSDFVVKENIDSVGIIPVRIGGATIEKNAIPTVRSKDDPIGFEILFSNNSLLTDNSLSVNSIVIDVLPYNDLNNPNLDLENYKLNNIKLETNLFDGNTLDYEIPSLEFFYTLENPSIVSEKTKSLIEINLNNKTLYNFEDSFWNKIKIDLVNNGDVYKITDSSLNNLINELSNKKITAFGLKANNISSNSTYRFYYEYDWDDKDIKEKHQSLDIVYNTVRLAVESNIFKETSDSAISFPNISKQIIKINDIKNDELNNKPVREEDIIIYRINYSNNTNNISNIKIIDKIPEGSSYVENSASDNGIYKSELNQLEWNFDNVDINSIGFVEFSVKVDKNDEIKEIVNKAEVIIDNNPLITNEIKNPKVIINGFKDSDPKNETKVKVDDVITYFITIKNDGIIDAKDIVIIDEIPKGTKFKDMDSNGKFIDGMVEFYIPILKSNEEIEVKFSVIVESDLHNPINNIAVYGDENIPNKETNVIKHFLDKIVISPTNIQNNSIIEYKVVDTANKITSNIYKIVIIISVILLSINKLKNKQ